jgi:hypothetical protein
MPFYFAQEQTALYSDNLFLKQELADCFVIDNQELSVFVLQSDNPYITNTDTINFINSDQVDLVVHVVVTHPWNFGSFAQHIEQVNVTKPWIQITWDTTLRGDNYAQFDYYASHLSDMIYTWGQEKYTTNSNQQRRYTFSCINNVAKAHRICVLYNLYGGNLWNTTLVSMSDTYLKSPVADAQPITYHNVGRDIREFMYDQYADDKFQRFYDLLPIKCPQERSAQIPFWVHDAFTNSYVNIVTEHDFQTNFASEKSIKPFLTEQIAVFVAGPGLVEKLRSFGLDVFDDIIDHSYDLEHNQELRLQKIFALIDSLSVKNWSLIYQQTQQRRLKNRNNLLSQTRLNQFKIDLRNQIEKIFSQ